MDKELKHDLSRDLNRVHQIITRALDVSIENSDKIIKLGYPDNDTKEGFLNYVSSLFTVIDVHHKLEDEVAFPFLQDRFPLAPFNILDKQHIEIVTKLREANNILTKLKNIESNLILNDLSKVLSEIKNLWHPHIALEEEQFASKEIMALINQEEQKRLAAEFANFSKTNAAPDYLIVPFLLYNLPEEERKLFAENLPPIIVNELAPVVWKDKWNSMKPFFLN
ncbi:MAG TPA: hemerythrin domain-containing protein [Ignavibacteriaceae bacterium]|nr:hemerythrin domain-containing protein [Ignavibacteriaceae bacterium]